MENWAKKKKEELREKEAPVKIDNQKEDTVRTETIINNHGKENENLKEDLVIIEERIIDLDKNLLETQDLALLQQLYQEKDVLERRWEVLCDQLGD